MIFFIVLISVLVAPSLQFKTFFTETRGLASLMRVYNLENSLVGLAHKESQSLLIKPQWIEDVKTFQKEILSSAYEPVVVVSLKKSHPYLNKKASKIWSSNKTPFLSRKGKKLVSLPVSLPKIKTSMLSYEKNQKKKLPQGFRFFHKNQLKKKTRQFIASGTVLWPSWLSKKDSLISIRREFEGRIYEEAIVSSHYPHYDIKLKQPFGDLVVEIFNSKGYVLARGQKDLQNTKPLEIKPSLGVKGFVKIKDKEQKITKASVWPFSDNFIYLKTSAPFLFDSLQLGSSYFLSLRGRSQKWGHLSFGRSGEFHYAEMLSDQFVEALLNQVLQNPKTSQVSIVWGRVVAEGVPQEGVTVEMGGSYDKPIYFTGFSPDFERNTTSQNGFFVFITDRQGLCPIRGFRGSKVFSVKTVFCQVDTVSLVNLEQRQKIPIGIAAYDPFDKSLKKAKVDFLGEELELKTSEKKDIFVSLPIGSGDRLITTQKQGYEITHMNVLKKRFSIKIPLISKHWLKNILLQKNISLKSHEGLFMGLFEREQFFELFLDGTPHKGEMILFNSQGEVVSKDSPNAKGFLLTDLSLGFHNLSLFFPSHEGRESFYNEVLFIEQEGINVMVYESSPLLTSRHSVKQKTKPSFRKSKVSIKTKKL